MGDGGVKEFITPVWSIPTLPIQLIIENLYLRPTPETEEPGVSREHEAEGSNNRCQQQQRPVDVGAAC